MSITRLLLLFSCLLLLPFGTAGGEVVKVMTIDGPIGAITLKHFERALKQAEEENAAALVIQMNTPGGVMETTLRITTAIMNAKVPVLVHVYPSGGRAASAGVYITYAAHVAAMASSTNIGSATPVSMTGEEIDSAMVKKIVNDAVANLRAAAEKRGRNADWAERAVREGISITSYDAVDSNVVDFAAETLVELLDKADGMVVMLPHGEDTVRTKGAIPEPVEKTFSENILDVITNPNIIFILFSLGTLGLAMELYNPGAIVPGVVGAICIILALFGMQALPINYAALALIIVAVIMFLLEIKVPSYGVLSIGGVIALVLGGLMLVDSPEAFLRVSLPVIITITICVGGFLIFAVGYIIKSHRKQVTTGFEGLVGQQGKVSETIDDEGMVYVAGALWYAVASERIERGEKVEILSGENRTLKVKRINSTKEE
ncbi:MAG: nodulation protein NfeD [candidate division Zixibacteria bacterium]|nr:nodulation protein NfeD [candidate division Zixibacteria bacterium]